MNEIINILKLGYFEAIKNASNNKTIKQYKIVLSDDIKSKLYDLGYMLGFNDYFIYYENND